MAWRSALAVSDSPPHQRRVLYQLARLGELVADDFALPHVEPNIDAAQREILTARNEAAQGRTQQAVFVLRRYATSNPAASEMLIEVLTRAGRVDEALEECDHSITRFGSDKVAHDKLNLLVRSGRLAEAHAFAATLLSGPDLVPEQRITLRRRLIQHSTSVNDWATAEQQCRGAYAAHPDQPDFAWGLITAYYRRTTWLSWYNAERACRVLDHDATCTRPTPRAWENLGQVRKDGDGRGLTLTCVGA